MKEMKLAVQKEKDGLNHFYLDNAQCSDGDGNEITACVSLGDELDVIVLFADILQNLERIKNEREAEAMGDEVNVETSNGNIRYLCRDCVEHRKGTITESQVRDSEFAKAGFVDGEDVEHCWFKVDDVKDGFVEGTLDNEPVRIKNIKYGDKVKVSLSEIEEVWDDEYRNSV